MQFSVPTLAAGIVIGIAAGAAVTVSLTNRYHINGKPTYFIRLDRLTGDLQTCSLNQCEAVEMKATSASVVSR
jgi:hypothetical protein